MPVVKSIATPIIWVLALLVGGLLLSMLSKRRHLQKAGWHSILLGVLALLVFSLNPVSNLLAYSLECRYAPISAEDLGAIDVLVVLGCGVHPSGGLRAEAELDGPAYSRWYNGVTMFRESNAGLLAFCGGPSWKDTESEAEVMKAMAVRMGVPANKILIETQSRNTRENAARLAELLAAGQKRQIGLVTSATHMLRSEKVFRKQFPNDVIVPIPVNYTYAPFHWTPGSFIPSATALVKSTVALHEWIGIIWYSLR